ncbi:hypothetical protein ABKN59_004467 [Abortiporus biennis]
MLAISILLRILPSGLYYFRVLIVKLTACVPKHDPSDSYARPIVNSVFGSTEEQQAMCMSRARSTSAKSSYEPRISSMRAKVGTCSH